MTLESRDIITNLTPMHAVPNFNGLLKYFQNNHESWDYTALNDFLFKLLTRQSISLNVAELYKFLDAIDFMNIYGVRLVNIPRDVFKATSKEPLSHAIISFNHINIPIMEYMLQHNHEFTELESLKILDYLCNNNSNCLSGIIEHAPFYTKRYLMMHLIWGALMPSRYDCRGHCKDFLRKATSNIGIEGKIVLKKNNLMNFLFSKGPEFGNMRPPNVRPSITWSKTNAMNVEFNDILKHVRFIFSTNVKSAIAYCEYLDLDYEWVNFMLSKVTDISSPQELLGKAPEGAIKGHVVRYIADSI